MKAQLPPLPDFRYVSLESGPRAHRGLWAGLLGAGASVGLWEGIGLRELALTTLTAAAAALAFRKMGGPRVARWGTLPANMAIVPWGVLVHPDGDRRRVLRWAAVKRVHVEMIYGRDQATPITLWSIVTIETDRERFAGRTSGAVSLDRLLAHLDAYADEQSHFIALDLDGERKGEGPTEPDWEPLLGAARAYVDSAPASDRLDLPPSGYRKTSSRAASGRTVEELRRVLRDRTPRAIDPRPFAAVVAAELSATELVDDLLPLVQSPHPVVAAVARQAATKLGAGATKVGALDEVAPFLMEQDAQSLVAWGHELRP